MMVSVIIPCKDEPYLESIIDSIHCGLYYSHEILLQTEAGLASAVLCGVRRAKGDIVAVLDADGSHNPLDLNKMVDLAQTFPLVIGSRYIQGGISYDSVSRRVISLSFCKVARFMLNIEIQDPMSGFIVAKRKVFETISIHTIGYKFALELLVRNNGSFRVLEFPIVFEKRKMGTSKTGFTEGIRTIAFIFLLWFWKKASSIKLFFV